MSGAAGCDVTLHHLTTLSLLPLSREHQKSIRRMWSVQDSVLPEGCGGEASPHISPPPQWEEATIKPLSPNPQHQRADICARARRAGKSTAP